MGRTKIPLEVRFWNKVEIRDQDSCWLWKACTNMWGYGTFRFGQISLAHRASYWLTFGPFSKELLVLHKCDNPPCVNPNHLFLGTNATNAADKVAKGRQSRVHGEKCGLSKLNQNQVVAIRNLYATGNYTQVELGKKYGLNHTTISRITLRKTWTLI